MCFSLFCEVNSRNVGGEWGGGRDDFFNINPNKAISMNGVDRPDKWDHPLMIPDQAAVGYLHLSFEYSKATLKIRVWQVSDLLLPPPQTSMIESLYVRSYFVPDTANKSNRRTELVRAEPPVKDANNSNNRQSSIQHIFSSSSFSFETSLIYTGLTQEMLADRNLQLEVCMIQKHTGKPFLMAMVFLPLRTAIRRPIREKYPLIPCMNHTTPNSMKVYSARDIIMNGSNSALNEKSSNHRSSFSGKSSENVEKFVQRFSSLDLSDSDDEGVGGSVGMISSPGVSFRSLTETPEKSSDSTDEEVEINFRKPIERSISSPSSPGSVQTRAKKKIIPNEILSRSLSSESCEDSEGGRIRRVSGKFTVIKVDEDYDIVPSSQTDLSEEVPDRSPDKENVSVKKKIIPNELASGPGAKIDSKVESNPTIQVSHKGVNGSGHCDTGKSRDAFQLSIHSTSEMASDIASTPGSRPETPVWDFYDFTEDSASQAGDKPETDVLGDDAAKALGTLQASILRLSRNTEVLDTCRVNGPVLPTVMIDDFEMEDEENNVLDISAT